MENGRGDRSRTCDFYLPKVALYQAELHPDGGAAHDTAAGGWVATVGNLSKPIARTDCGVVCSFALRLSSGDVSLLTARLLAFDPFVTVFRGFPWCGGASGQARTLDGPGNPCVLMGLGEGGMNLERPALELFA